VQLHPRIHYALGLMHVKSLKSALKNADEVKSVEMKLRSDAELEQLAELPHLMHLELSVSRTELPEALFSLRNLELLNIRGRKLAKLSPSIGKLGKLRILRLERNALTALPPAIGKLKKLEQLNVEANSLSSLPAAIGKCSSLAFLQLDGNAFTKLPKALMKLPLHDLHLCSNELEALPKGFAELKSLRGLYLNGNAGIELDELPAGLENLTLRKCKLAAVPPVVFALKKLRFLDLIGNPLKHLPNDIGKPKALSLLYLNRCKLDELPPRLGSLRKLERLELAHNRLSELPPSLAQLSALVELNLDDNRFESMPEVLGELRSLTHLHFRKNHLTALSDAVARLDKLERLQLTNNPLKEFAEDLRGMKSLELLTLSPAVERDALKSQLVHLPPAARLRTPADGDIAKEGRWTDEPAPTTGGEDRVFQFEHDVDRVAFVGGTVVGSCYDRLAAYDVATGELRFERPGYHAWFAPSPDGRRLLVATPKALLLLDAETGAGLDPPKGPTGAAMAEWSADGKMLLFVVGPKWLLLDAATGKLLDEREETKSLSFARLSADGQRVLYAVERSLRLWDRAAGKERVRVSLDKRRVFDGHFIGDDDAFAVTRNLSEPVRVVELSKKKPKPRDIGEGEVHALVRVPDGRIVTSDDHAELHLWDVATGDALGTVGKHLDEGRVTALAVNGDGTQLVSGGGDKTMRVWQLS